MNIFNKITLQGLKKNRTRTVVTIIGVILSVSMITAVTTLISSVQNFIIQDSIATYGNWHIQLFNNTSDTIETLRSDEDVSKLGVVQIEAAIINDDEDEAFTFYRFDQAALEIIPFQTGRFDRLQSLIDGRLPQNANEVVVSARTGTAIGETIAVTFGYWEIGEIIEEGEGFQIFDEYFVRAGSETFTVVGITSQSRWGSNAAFTLLESLEQDQRYNAIVRLNNPRDFADFTERMGAAHYGYELNRDLMRFMGIATGGMFDTFLAVLYSLGAIVIILIMLGSVSLIYNSFAISVSERTKQFGILSSVGATGKQIRKSVLFEGVFVGAIGIPLGILTGVGGIGVALVVVRDAFAMMAMGRTVLSLSVSAIALVIAVLVGTLTIFISAFIPARKASKKSAIDTIRQSDDVKLGAKSMKTSRLTKLLFGLEGELAAKNFKRNKKRYRATVLSLVISVVLFISASSFGIYLQLSSGVALDAHEFDLRFWSHDLDNETVLCLYDEFRQVSHITESGYSFLRVLRADISPDLFSERYKQAFQEFPHDDFRIHAIIYFVDNEMYAQLRRDTRVSGDGFLATATSIQFNQETRRFENLALFRGNVSSLSFRLIDRDEKEMEIEVTLIEHAPRLLAETAQQGLVIFIPASDRNEFPLSEGYHGDGFSMSFLSDDPMQSADEMYNIIELRGIGDFTFTNVYEIQQQERQIIFLLNFFIYGFIILISLITIANVFNTVSTSINLRKREFAMLRSIGMTERGFGRMMNFECLFYGLKALLFGLPLSLAITFLIYQAVIGGIDVPFVLPWAGIGIAVFSVFFVVFVTMLYSVRKLKKANVIDALRTEIA